MRTVLLISGFSNSGKDLMANFITSKFHTFTKLSFADSVKQFASKKHNIEYSLFLSQEGKRTLHNNISLRNIIIQEAENAKLKDPNVWVKKILDKINKNKIGNVVIPDFRFPNEFEYIKNNLECNLVTVRINRHIVSPVVSKTEYLLDDFDFDHYIENTSSIENFYKQIKFSFLV
jgi:hypothetical protein